MAFAAKPALPGPASRTTTRKPRRRIAAPPPSDAGVIDKIDESLKKASPRATRRAGPRLSASVRRNEPAQSRANAGM